MNTEQIIQAIYKFLAFVRLKDNGLPLSFVDKNSFLGREENYKAEAAERARNKLEYETWQESLIGSGEILERCRKAKACAQNLVNIYNQLKFDNITDTNPNAERVLYDVYRGGDEARAFNNARDTFKNYDMVAYLFFVKDSSRFLPVVPGSFESSLESIGINYKLSHNCSWGNYSGFIEITRGIQSVMQDIIPDISVRLIDAHSFLWVINEPEFRNWKPNTEVLSATLRRINVK